MSETGLVQIIEGALLAAGRPMTVAQLADLFEEPERPENTVIRETLDEVAARCEDRGFELKQVASGFRFQVRQNLSPWIARLWHERPQRYSRALLETLALIAYRQPITRGEIEEIRGVAVSSSIVKTLHEREWIRVVGHRDVPGRPAMYATTKQFLDYFNLKTLDQLPALAEIRDLETLNAELGFSDPLPEGTKDDAEGSPELTVVGGTEHVPEDELAETETESGELDETSEASQTEGNLDRETPVEDSSEEDSREEDGISEESQGISLSEAADALESRVVEPVEEVDGEEEGEEEGSEKVGNEQAEFDEVIGDSADEDNYSEAESIKPESQA